VLDYRSQIRKK